jgi:hypothetical protein
MAGLGLYSFVWGATVQQFSMWTLRDSDSTSGWGRVLSLELEKFANQKCKMSGGYCAEAA